MASITTEELINLIYPKIYDLNEFLTDEIDDIFTSDNSVNIPSIVPNAQKFMVDHTPGQFLIDNSNQLIITIVGEDDIDIPTFQKVFNCPNVQEYKQIISANSTGVELNLDHKYGHLVNQFVEWLRSTKEFTVPSVKFMHVSNKNMEGNHHMLPQFIEDNQFEVQK